MNFEIVKRSQKSRARLGFLETAHGVVETPALVPVATQATVKTLTPEETRATGSQILICNTFHLHLKPGEKFVSAAGGLHKFMNWPRPLMTDSGGFQVFSMGFGTDYGVGKVLNQKRELSIKADHQPKAITIREDGVMFRSPVDGRQLFIGPKESIKLQEQLGADILFAFDECPPPLADRAYTQKSMMRTHRWAELCLKYKKSDQALFGIVQGGKFKDLRLASAKFIAGLDFAGFGIGGELGFDKPTMFKMLDWIMNSLPEQKPRHMLGTGRLEDLAKTFQSGVDTVDCIIPTHYARHGTAFTSVGKLDLNKAKFLKERKPLDPKCVCPICQQYSRSYICHLLKAKEISPLRMLTFHNLFYFNNFVAQIRNQIKQGKL